MGVSGSVWLHEAGGGSLGDDRVGLLEAIERHGSITKAAKAVGISYKKAWDVVAAVNNLSGRPLVHRAAGGKGGGGTVLTGAGKELVRKYRLIQREHRAFLRTLKERIGEPDDVFPLLRRIAMKVSARNLFHGRVSNIRKGAVNSEVTLSLPGGDAVVAIVTNESVGDLGLESGRDAYAIVKASSVILGRDIHGARISARNVLCGTVARIDEGAVNATVTVNLSGENTITAVITGESLKGLGFKVGEHACAAVKASSVILGVDG